jgi:hypothetical protein
VDPVPSWPEPFAPQHHSVWSVRIPQVCDAPAVTLSHDAMPTCVALDVLVVEPMPSRPLPLLPQHQSVASGLIAQVCPEPDATADQSPGADAPTAGWRATSGDTAKASTNSATRADLTTFGRYGPMIAAVLANSQK